MCTGAPSNEGKLSTEKEAPLLIFLGVRNGVGAGGGSMLCGLGQTAPSVGLRAHTCLSTHRTGFPSEHPLRVRSIYQGVYQELFHRGTNLAVF